MPLLIIIIQRLHFNFCSAVNFLVCFAYGLRDCYVVLHFSKYSRNHTKSKAIAGVSLWTICNFCSCNTLCFCTWLIAVLWSNIIIYKVRNHSNRLSLYRTVKYANEYTLSHVRIVLRQFVFVLWPHYLILTYVILYIIVCNETVVLHNAGRVLVLVYYICIARIQVEITYINVANAVKNLKLLKYRIFFSFNVLTYIKSLLIYRNSYNLLIWYLRE